MADSLPSDATVATVWPHLVHDREYVAGVRHKMLACVKSYGSAYVRIGITGTGQKPCYRITYLEDGVEQIFGSYWDNHQALDNEKAASSNWSSAFMSFDEIDAFLRAKIGRKLHG